MKNNKKLSLSRILICLLAPLLIAALALGFCFADKSAKAMTAYPHVPSISKPLYDYSTYSYDEDALNELSRAILDKSDATIDKLITHIKDRAKTTGLPIARKDITVAYGRFAGISSGTNYSNLVWMPVYLSTTRTGDAVLTLYLAATNGPRSGQENGGITGYDIKNGAGKGQYTSDINCAVPSNMYGMSYMRAFTLGNGGKYASYDAAHSPSYTPHDTDKLKDTSSHKYLEFLTYIEGSGEDTVASMGYLYEDIVTPSEMVWQANESYKQAIGATGVITDGAGEGKAGGDAAWENYCFPNESYDAPQSGAYSRSEFDYKNKTGYANWQNDKVWIPSLSEVGTGTDVSSGNLNGLWQLTANQRGNDKNARPSWLRTANTLYDEGGNGYSTYAMFCAELDGTIKTHKLDETNIAVRPAIHLNLSAARDKIAPPVVVPDTVKSEYNGEEQTLSDTLVTLPDEEAAWFKKGEMHVEFFYDRDCATAAAPLNAGEYYMRVTLDRMDLYFVKCQRGQRSKVVKFVVEKAKLGVKWTEEANVPKSIDFAPGSVIYDRDKKAGNVPKVAIKYVSTTGSGETFYSYNDLLRGGYRGHAYIVDSDKYDYNYELDASLGDPLQSSSFEVGRKIIDMPNFLGYTNEDTEINVMYAGEQYIQIANASKYLKVEVRSMLSTSKVEELGLSDQGYLTYKVSAVDKYTFNFTFVDNDYFTWPGDYNYSETGEDEGADTSQRSLVLNVNRAKVDVSFVGLPSEWNTISSPTFSIAVYGIYNQDNVNPISMRTYYTNNATGRQTNLTAEAGVYTLRGVPAGEYTLYAIMNDPNYIKNYYMDPAYKMQNFKVVKTVSTLSDNDIKWQYSHNGKMSTSFGFSEHDTEETALVFDYDDKNYVFSLTLSEAVLHDKYYVKATYSGDTYEKNAGLHCVTVSVAAFNKSVEFEDRDYKVYFKINPIKYDISQLEWGYDPNSPLVYNGAAKKVRLTAESLANYPGLTAEYSTNGDRIAAGDYVTSVSFQLAETYAVNYILPVAGDENSYDGEFAFTCSWKIAKAKLAVEWNELVEDDGSGLLYVPTLKVGHEYVDYIYEKKNSDGTWTPAENLVADGATETFRAKAVIKAAYAQNYELENDVPCEFEVASGKHPVSVHFERDGETVESGAEFPYSGEPVSLSLAVDSGGLSVKEYSFKYYSVDANNTRTELSGAPVEVGRYAAVVTAKFGTDTYLSSESTTEIEFNIGKADYDISQIYWMYEHGDKIVAARFDGEQNKWVDESGKEVLFTFEYDGTPHILRVDCQQRFADEADKLTATVRGNTATDASDTDLSAIVEFKYNENRFNNPSPAFPRTLAWRITKKKINYSEVRWGYIDADGKERDFDFENDAFEFTRDENGIVGITVALIGLPQGIQDLITYKTQDLIVAGSQATVGNTRFEVGEYITNFEISGSWSDPNYEDFNAADFPKTIPSLCSWQIKRRALSKIDYKDGFTVFDNKVHSIIELCNIPEEELVYFNIDVTFVDSTGKNVYNNYAGYEDAANMIFHAGTYDIRFYELIGEDETPVIWDFISIEVAKWKLNVSWDEAGAYPVATVTDLYAADKVGTKYYNKKDAEVPLAYVRSTDGEEQFCARACVTEAYERDIDLIVADDKKAVYFYYHSFKPSAGAAKLEYPVMVSASAEYTGENITFAIDQWDSLFGEYLYIADGNLVQKDIGEYHVLLRFSKDADAYWKDKSSAAEEEYNRDAYILTFTITPPTKWAIDRPVIDNTVVEYTGEKINFTINDWDVLKKFLDYEVFYKGQSLGKTLSFTRGGRYTVVFTFPEDSIGYWRDAAEENARDEYIIAITIYGDDKEPLEIATPELDRVTAEYTGSALEFKLKGGTDYLDYIEFEECPGVEIVGGVLKAVQAGDYSVKVKIKSGVVYTFENGKTEYVLNFSITMPLNPVEDVPLEKPVLNVTRQKLEGDEVTFYITGWAETYSNFVVLTCENGGVTIIDGTIKVSAVGTFTLKVSFKDGAKAVWKDTNDKKDVILNFEVYAEAKPGEVIKPTMLVESKQYNGKEQTFEFNSFNADQIEIVTDGSDSLTQKEVGVYTVKLRLKNPKTADNPDGFTWQIPQGSTDDITLTFKIVALKIDGIGIGSNGKPVVVDKEGNPVPDLDVDLGELLDVEYYDKDGNKVDAKDLVEGEDYKAKLIVKDEAKFDKSIDGGQSIRDGIVDVNSKGGYDLSGFKPEEPPEPEKPEPKGLATIWWVVIIAGAVLLLLLIIIIIVVAKRKSGGGDGYDDGYDEGYDDYDDDDGYDDDDYDDDDYDDDDEY